MSDTIIIGEEEWEVISHPDAAFLRIQKTVENKNNIYIEEVVIGNNTVSVSYYDGKDPSYDDDGWYGASVSKIAILRAVEEYNKRVKLDD